jgi:aminopeptidase
LDAALITATAGHLRGTLLHAFHHTAAHAAVVVYDARCELAQAMTAAYRQALPTAQFIDFDASTPAEVMAALAALQAADLVVLIQSTSFRLEAFRIRVELFRRGLKVIEHPHLVRMLGIEPEFYLDSLAFDAAYYGGVGRALKAQIDGSRVARVESGAGAQLHFPVGFESAKLNIGDYTGMANMGGQFPIGEVFTESRDLRAVHGRIFAFGDATFTVNQPAIPITLIIEQGQIAATEDSTPEFDRVLADIRADEGVVWLRELGFGLNRAFTRQRVVSDIGTFERMCGIHLSLGAKHGIYAKPGFKRDQGKHHVDVFAVTEAVWLGDTCVYHDGAWTVIADAG